MSRSRVFIVAPAVLAVALWYAAIYQPAKTAMTQDHQAITAARQQLQIASVNPPATPDPAALDAQLERLRSAVPSEIDLGTFFTSVNEAAAQAGVKLLDTTPAAPQSPATEAGTVDPAAPAPAAPAISIGIHQVARGERARLVDYLSKLTALDRLVVVDDVTLTTEDASTSSLTIEMRIFAAT
jgi:Tfp pilus assembly protein PilO